MAEKGKMKEEVFISEDDQYLFGQGTHYEIYKKLGAHVSVQNGVKGVYFAVWAPNAECVSVIGSFNNWNDNVHPMTKLGEGGIYACFIENAAVGDMYKYVILTKDGTKLYKADPYANQAQYRPETASIVADISQFKWGDALWLKDRQEQDIQKLPVAIYECHIGSWMKHPNGTEDGFYNYREFADRLVGYMKEMKYTQDRKSVV